MPTAGSEGGLLPLLPSFDNGIRFIPVVVISRVDSVAKQERRS